MDEDDKLRLKKVKEKARFYFQENIKAHIIIQPQGWRNGFFKSDLKDNTFYWFEEHTVDGRVLPQIRLFLSDIHDIGDYRKKELKTE